MAAEFNGTKLRIYTGASPVAIEMETDCELDFNASAVTFRNKDSGNWREILAGAGELTADWNFNFHADISGSASNNFEELYDALVAGTLVTVKAATTETGWMTLSGSFKVTNLKITAADSEDVEGSCSLMSASALTKGVVA
jgi:predicted secreted protein